MKAKPVRLTPHDGYVECAIEDATHVSLRIPGPTGLLTLPVIRSGTRDGTGCWTWNGSTEAPTLRPSVLSTYQSAIAERSWRCHSWINDGAVQFLDDCSHDMAGTTVALLDVDSTPAKAEAASLQDGAWYHVRYEGLGKVYEAPAMFRAAAEAFYSVEFSGIPAREVEVLADCAMSAPPAPSQEPPAKLEISLTFAADDGGDETCVITAHGTERDMRRLEARVGFWTRLEQAAPQDGSKAPAAWPVEADLLTQAIQRLNSNPYNLTKSECIQVISELRTSLQQPRVGSDTMIVHHNCPCIDECSDLGCQAYCDGQDKSAQPSELKGEQCSPRGG